MTEEWILTEAVKEAVPPLIALWSKSGGGKTYSALLMARGIVGEGGKVALIDTENGRAKFYSTGFETKFGKWFHLPFEPPFTPERMSSAFEFCENKGADICIIDSGSHVWEGEGGVIDMAEEGRTKAGKVRQGLDKWNKPKMAHKRMMNKLVRSKIPVIFCLRAKDGSEQKGFGANATIVKTGLQPVAERNFIFEMQVCLHLTEDGKYDLKMSKSLPEQLRGKIIAGGTITEQTGIDIAEWSGSGTPMDESLIDLKRAGVDASLLGVEDFTAWGKSLEEDERAKVSPFLSQWLADAKASDKENEEVI